MTESELLTVLLKDPESYVGHKSVEKASAFLNGYRDALEIAPDPVYRGFNKWLQKALRIAQDRDWVRIIYFFGQSEVDAFELARKLWMRYLNEMGSYTHLTSHKASLSPLGTNNPSELLDRIVEMPSFYVGRESVALSKAYLDGYRFASREAGVARVDLLYDGFQDWVAARFHVKTAHDWASIITFIGISENGGFELVKQLWEKYKSEKENDVGTCCPESD